MDHREYQVDDVYDDNPSSVFCEECTNIVSRSSAEKVYDEFIGQIVWKCKGCLSPEEEGTMKYKTWQFSNLHNRYLLDLYAWTISIWKKPHNWDLYWHGKTWFCVGMFEFMHHPQPKPVYAMKFIIRVYTPNDPFHARKTYFQGTTNGEWYLHIAFFGWEVMLGNTSIYISEMESLSQKINEYMPFFMWVDHE